MKKILGIMGVVFLFLLVSGISINADTYDGLTYVVSNNTVTITDCDTTAQGNASEGKYTIPSKINGYTVTAIGDRAFSGCSKIKKMVIPNTVKTIGDYAFYGCEFTSITIPSTVTTIGEGAFYNCIKLAEITVPNTVTSLGEYAFYGCSSLKSVSLSNKLERIAYGTFNGCEIIESITIPSSVKFIDANAFSFCRGLKNISIPSNVIRIEAAAFYYCENLEWISITSGTLYIGEGVFEGCSSLNEIRLSADNPRYTLVNGALLNEAQTELIAYPPQREGTVYTVPEGVTVIYKGAFKGAAKLESIILPGSLETISYRVFQGCTSLTDVYYKGTESQWQGVTKYSGNDILSGDAVTMHYQIIVTYIGDYTGTDSLFPGSVTALPQAPEGYSYHFSVGGLEWDGTNLTEDVEVVVTAVENPFRCTGFSYADGFCDFSIKLLGGMESCETAFVIVAVYDSEYSLLEIKKSW